jgi:hypothetical protein
MIAADVPVGAGCANISPYRGRRRRRRAGLAARHVERFETAPTISP